LQLANSGCTPPPVAGSPFEIHFGLFTAATLCVIRPSFSGKSLVFHCWLVLFCLEPLRIKGKFAFFIPHFSWVCFKMKGVGGSPNLVLVGCVSKGAPIFFLPPMFAFLHGSQVCQSCSALVSWVTWASFSGTSPGPFPASWLFLNFPNLSCYLYFGMVFFSKTQGPI